MRTRGKMLAAMALAAATLGATLSTAAPAVAGTPPYQANCTGGQGDLNAFRNMRNFATPLRKYNAEDSVRVGTLPARAPVHIFYKTTDASGRGMYAVQYSDRQHDLCGYEYQTSIDWSS